MANPSNVNDQLYLDYWEIKAQNGETTNKGIIGTGVTSFDIPIQSLRKGYYYLTLNKAETNHTFSFLKM